MNFEEYERGENAKYAEFAAVVLAILRAALEPNKDFRLYTGQSRAKGRNSLFTKLRHRNLLEHPNIGQQIKDLAGCRLIFYSNDDVNRFMHSHIVPDNFEVIWDESKIHHPVGDSDDVNELYRALHFVVRLKPERANLPEYSKYAGLKCEIQVQTILDHAWSETGHDIIYKSDEIKGFGTHLGDQIKARMASIMQKYLVLAGYEFQKVLHDFARLAQGRDLFNQQIASKILNAADNNERHAALEGYREYVVPNYDNKESVVREIFHVAQTAIEVARVTPTKTVESPIGELEGKTSDDVAEIALRIIEDVKYIDRIQTFSILRSLYASCTSDIERKRILEAVEKLAKHNIHAWQQAGPLVQYELSEQFKDLKDEELEFLRELLVRTCSCILGPEVSGSALSSFDTVTIFSGTVTDSKELKTARQRSIDLLKRLFLRAENIEQKRNAINALNQGMRIASMGGNRDEMLLMVLENRQGILEFNLAHIEGQEYEILQALEHDFHDQYHSSLQWRSVSGVSDAVKEAVAKFATTILRYRDAVNQDAGFVKYKTLVGFESIFPPHWENDNFDFDGMAAYRENKIAEYVNEIESTNADSWFTFLRRCAQTKSDDGATFIAFGTFLRRLSEQKPSLVLSRLNELGPDLETFLHVFLSGLKKSNLSNESQIIVNEWVRDKRQLLAITLHYRNDPPLDSERLRTAIQAAGEVGDTTSLVLGIETCFEHFNDTNKDSLLPIFLSTVDRLTQLKEARWINVIWHKTNKPNLLDMLDASNASRVLENLLYRTEIDHHAETILTRIAQNHPELVFRHFGRRLQYEEQANAGRKPLDFKDRYDALPYEFNELAPSLAKIPKECVQIARAWYEESTELFQFRGGKVLANVFPKFIPEFEKPLIELIQGGDIKDIDFVLDVLRNYHGEAFLHPICKELVKVIREDDRERISEVEVILESSGVLRGVFGHVELYKARKEEISPWLEDDSEKVRAFAQKYTASLNRQIAAGQRSAEQDLALRKLDFGPIESQTESKEAAEPRKPLDREDRNKRRKKKPGKKKARSKRPRKK